MLSAAHQLDTKPIDLHTVIHESLALVAHDMRTRQIQATINPSSNPSIINSNQVLLQQVMVNLIMNTMNTMTETPPGRRHVTISTQVRAADIHVSVRDAGTGLPAQINSALFKPFVTTKAHGLGIGLTITQTIVDTHRGTIEARNNPEGGATFTVTLRPSGTPEMLRSPTHLTRRDCTHPRVASPRLLHATSVAALRAHPDARLTLLRPKHVAARGDATTSFSL